MLVSTHSLPGSVLQVAERTLDPRLAAITRSCYGYEEWSRSAIERSEYATADVVLILEIGAPLSVSNGPAQARHRGGFVAGLHDGPTTTAHDGHQAGIQINLPPLVARRLLGVPLSRVAHEVVAVTDLLAPADRGLPSRLAELADWDARLRLVEQWLLALAQRKSPRDLRALEWVVARIEATSGAAPIRALAMELGWSERRLQRAFQEHVGLSPKLFARLVRFEALLAHMRAVPGARWANAAYALGYADQSHLVRDVRQFTGGTPSMTADRLQLLTAVE